jgi:hypothetical protein
LWRFLNSRASRVGGAGVGFVAARLAIPVGLAWLLRPPPPPSVASSLPMKLLWLTKAWINMPSTEKCSLLNSLA